MKELSEILQIHQGDWLIDRLQASDYAFAAWQMPNSSTTHFIISLDTVSKVEDFQLAEAGQGFLVNAYSDSHPIKPYWIQADIIIRDKEVSINPHVKASQIDLLLERLAIEPKEAPEISDFQIPTPANSYETLVKEAVEAIRGGLFDKVVLSRYKDEFLPEQFSPWNFFNTICKQYPAAFCNLFHIPSQGLWIGATPELLISNTSECFKTVALAGTKKLEKDQHLNEIAWTQKEIEEQAMVSRYIINCFKKIRLREFREHGPRTAQAGNVAHLKTIFEVSHDEVHFHDLPSQMLALLHPTSAVCGMPMKETIAWIAAKEQYDRQFYTGFLGPVGFESAINLFVNLRCSRIKNRTIRFYAGAGITEDSSPQKEFEETEMKMNTLKSHLPSFNLP